MKLGCRDQFDGVRSIMKTRQENDMIDRIGLVKVETKTELSGPIWSSVVCDEN